MGWFWSGAATRVKAGRGHGFGRQCRWLVALQEAGSESGAGEGGSCRRWSVVLLWVVVRG